MRKPVVLIVDDEKDVREMLKLILDDNYETVLAKDAFEAVETVRTRAVDMVLLDVNLPGVDGLKALESIKEIGQEIGVVMLSATDSASQAVMALKKGAYDYITKPFDNDDLLSTLKRYSDTLYLKTKVDFLRGELQDKCGYGEMISISPRMRPVFELIKKVGPTSSSVLITGESGTGKELVARAIVSMSGRRDKPFVAVNCGAVPSELIESELFGHEKGAFTGAHARKIGRFEYADGGTVFLDEVSTLPMHLQIKLLRVLQEKSFERVGSNVPLKVDIRVIAATNVDLEKEVREGRFREDLFYRLKVVPIELPPLRERKEDIPVLVRHFIDKLGRKCSKRISGISERVLESLEDYPWPGNIRELENLMERLIVLAKEGAVICYEDLPAGLFNAAQAEGSEAADLREAVKIFERRHIIGALNRNNWSRSEAAKELRIHRNTLLQKMKELRIKDR